MFFELLLSFQTQVLFDKILNDVTKQLSTDTTQQSDSAELQNTLITCLQVIKTKVIIVWLVVFNQLYLFFLQIKKIR